MTLTYQVQEFVPVPIERLGPRPFPLPCEKLPEGLAYGDVVMILTSTGKALASPLGGDQHFILHKPGDTPKSWFLR